MNQLAPCPHCKRHVRVTESTCPFCETSVGAALTSRARPSVSTRGLSRASILALGASMAAAVGVGLLEGCAEEPDPDGDDGKDKPAADAGSSMPPGTVTPVYGAPVQQDAGSNNPPQREDGGMVAIYGAPVQPDGGRVQPVYGAPIQPLDASQNDAGASDAGKDAAISDAGKDAGRVDDGGRVAPVYGAPVPFYGAPVQPSIKTDGE